MAGNSHEPDKPVEMPDLSRPENRFEHRDVNVWAVYKFGIALSVLCIVSFGLLFGLYRYFLDREGGPLPAGHENVDARELPPMPRLQSAPIQDLQDMRAAGPFRNADVQQNTSRSLGCIMMVEYKGWVELDQVPYWGTVVVDRQKRL